MREEFRTPLFGHFDDDPCEDCGAPGGTRCRLECPSGMGEIDPYRPPRDPREDFDL